MQDLHRLLERIRTELSKPTGQARLSRPDLRSLLSALESFLLLRAYIRHDPGCGALRGLHWKRHCTCGLDRHLHPPENSPSSTEPADPA